MFQTPKFWAGEVSKKENMLSETDLEKMYIGMRADFHSNVKIGDKVRYSAPMTITPDGIDFSAGGRFSYVATYVARVNNSPNSKIIIESYTGCVDVDPVTVKKYTL